MPDKHKSLVRLPLRGKSSGYFPRKKKLVPNSCGWGLWFSVLPRDLFGCIRWNRLCITENKKDWMRVDFSCPAHDP